MKQRMHVQAGAGYAQARGAALLLVLWLLALLAALVGAFALTAQTEHLQGLVMGRGLAAEQVARAGVEYALGRLRMEDPRQRWVADGRSYRWSFGGARVEIEIIDEQGKVDLNTADANLLAALMQVVGVEPTQAGQVAGAILDWRDTDSLTQPSGGAEDADYAAAGRHYGAADVPLESVAEVEQVLGMTPALYAKLAPYLTVYSGSPMPDQAAAAPQVLQAMGLDAARIVARRQAWDPATGAAPPGGIVGARSGTYSIRSRALLGGRSGELRVVARVGGTGVPGSAWTPLRWEEGPLPR